MNSLLPTQSFISRIQYVLFFSPIISSEKRDLHEFFHGALCEPVIFSGFSPFAALGYENFD